MPPRVADDGAPSAAGIDADAPPATCSFRLPAELAAAVVRPVRA